MTNNMNMSVDSKISIRNCRNSSRSRHSRLRLRQSRTRCALDRRHVHTLIITENYETAREQQIRRRIERHYMKRVTTIN